VTAPLADVIPIDPRRQADSPQPVAGPPWRVRLARSEFARDLGDCAWIVALAAAFIAGAAFGDLLHQWAQR
jgi:hypothetical protein